MNIEELLKIGVLRLKDTKYGRLEAEILLADILKKERVYLHINIHKEVEEQTIKKFENHISYLIDGKPIQYILGRQEWMGLEFFVDENVLIPREDTRILLEQIINLKEKFTEPTIVEIGTGSGILPVLIKKAWPEAKIFVTEISKDTLDVARKNFIEHDVMIESFNCDFLDDIKKNNIKADILFSNPPYISEEEYETLDKEVKKEPYGALVGGNDGLDYYRRIGEEYIDVLSKNAYILVEIGWRQYEDVRKIFEEKGLIFRGIYKDDGDRDRVLVMEYMNDN